jgi:hypothetical protein
LGSTRRCARSSPRGSPCPRPADGEAAGMRGGRHQSAPPGCPCAGVRVERVVRWWLPSGVGWAPEWEPGVPTTSVVLSCPTRNFNVLPAA